MWSIRLLLIETDIWPAPLTVVEGGDGAWDAVDGDRDRTTSNDMARDFLSMLKNFHSNSGDAEYSPSVDRDGYQQRLAVLTHGDGGDGAWDAGDGAGDRTKSSDVARDVLYAKELSSQFW
jgi:hypothetical protein